MVDRAVPSLFSQTCEERVFIDTPRQAHPRGRRKFRDKSAICCAFDVEFEYLSKRSFLSVPCSWMKSSRHCFLQNLGLRRFACFVALSSLGCFWKRREQAAKWRVLKNQPITTNARLVQTLQVYFFHPSLFSSTSASIWNTLLLLLNQFSEIDSFLWTKISDNNWFFLFLLFKLLVFLLLFFCKTMVLKIMSNKQLSPLDMCAMSAWNVPVFFDTNKQSGREATMVLILNIKIQRK